MGLPHSASDSAWSVSGQSLKHGRRKCRRTRRRDWTIPLGRTEDTSPCDPAHTAADTTNRTCIRNQSVLRFNIKWTRCKCSRVQSHMYVWFYHVAIKSNHIFGWTYTHASTHTRTSCSCRNPMLVFPSQIFEFTFISPVVSWNMSIL